MRTVAFRFFLKFAMVLCVDVLVQMLVELITTNVWRMGPRELSTVLHAYAQLGHTIDSQTQSLLRLAIASKLERFNPQVRYPLFNVISHS